MCKFGLRFFSFYSKVLKIDFPHDPLIVILGWGPFLEKYSFNQIQIEWDLLWDDHSKKYNFVDVEQRVCT